MKIPAAYLVLLLLSACSQNSINNRLHGDLNFAAVESDFAITDLNQYACEKIDHGVLRHVLETGTVTTQVELHDHYDTTGCSIAGELARNGQMISFSFDYGGIFYFGDGTTLACGKACCQNGFTYCSYDESGLKGD